MNMFSKMSSVKTFEKSKYFQEGIYVVRILECKSLKNRQKQEMIAIECEVLGTKSDASNAPKAGETAAHIWNLEKDMGLPTWKQFLTAVIGEDEAEALADEDWEDLSEKVLDDNELEGTVMFLEAFMTKTKADNDFTVHNWQRPATDGDYKKVGLTPPE